MGRSTTLVLVALILILLLLAWHQGGEEPVRPIEQDVPAPGTMR